MELNALLPGDVVLFCFGFKSMVSRFNGLFTISRRSICTRAARQGSEAKIFVLFCYIMWFSVNETFLALMFGTSGEHVWSIIKNSLKNVEFVMFC